MGSQLGFRTTQSGESGVTKCKPWNMSEVVLLTMLGLSWLWLQETVGQEYKGSHSDKGGYLGQRGWVLADFLYRVTWTSGPLDPK